MILTYGNNTLRYNTRWFDYNIPDPYNPLHLRPYTIRVRIRAGERPSYNYNGLSDDVGALMEWTCVDETNNIWDFHFPYNDWSGTNNITNTYSRLGNKNRILEILGFNSRGIEDMSQLFIQFGYVTEVPLFDTSTVTNMTNMFASCSVTTVPLYDTSNVTNMSGMFWNINGNANHKLTSVPLFNTSKVTNMNSMFAQCYNIRTVPHFDTHLVTEFNAMFSHCTNLSTVPLFDMSSATDVSWMFWDCANLEEVPHFNTSNVEDMERFVEGCSKLTTLPLFNTSKVTDLDYAFAGTVGVTDRSGYDLYLQASRQATPPATHGQAFRNCGPRVYLDQIPQDWK